jgi:cold shock CspA family protein
MLMIFKYLTLSYGNFSNTLDLNDHRKTERFFRQFQDIMHNEDRALKLFQDSQNLIEQAVEAKRGDYRSKLNRLPGFTDYILYDLLDVSPRARVRKTLARVDPGIKVGKEYTSTVARLCEGFGFIAYRAPEINNLFFHWTYLADGVDFMNLAEGMEVMFTAEENSDARKGKFVAKNIRLA